MQTNMAEERVVPPISLQNARVHNGETLNTYTYLLNLRAIAESLSVEAKCWPQTYVFNL